MSAKIFQISYNLNNFIQAGQPQKRIVVSNRRWPRDRFYCNSTNNCPIWQIVVRSHWHQSNRTDSRMPFLFLVTVIRYVTSLLSSFSTAVVQDAFKGSWLKWEMLAFCKKNLPQLKNIYTSLLTRLIADKDPINYLTITARTRNFRPNVKGKSCEQGCLRHVQWGDYVKDAYASDCSANPPL